MDGIIIGLMSMILHLINLANKILNFKNGKMMNINAFLKNSSKHSKKLNLNSQNALFQDA